MAAILSELTALAAVLATPKGVAIGVASFLGLGCALLGSFTRTMVRLRIFGVLSNAFLLIGALLAPNPVSIVLFMILLPLNAWRLREIVQLTKKVAAASKAGDTSGLWLKPYMRASRYAAGTVLFNRGDAADGIYLPVEGQLELVEIGKTAPLGEIFGEVSFFAPGNRRTLTARCVTDCLVLHIGAATFRQLYFQNPKFAFMVSELVAQRLSADVQRLQARVAQLEGSSG